LFPNKETDMNRADALEFVSKNHRAVLVTRRADEGLQTSPILVGVDGDGYAVISSRETAFKVRNLRRDPRATLCVFSDNFFGEWIQIDGAADLISMPDAMERLVDYYRRISGEHPDWDEYRSAMNEQKRLIIRISIDKVGPTRQG
jgi:PPOX class probable F420-dependent enzyme